MISLRLFFHRGFFRAAAASLLLPFLVAPAARAQSGGTGVVTGTVSNASTRQFLQAAEVRVDGTNLVVVTQSDGSFRLSNVPSGQQNITVSYRGLDPESRTITVTPGGTHRVEFGLGSEVYQMDAFVVAGEREGQAKAVNDQKNSDFMKSVVASDQFGDLVDSNAAELLKSLPGFAMNYAGEDAISFSMRGQVGSSRVDLQACKLEYSIVSPK